MGTTAENTDRHYFVGLAEDHDKFRGNLEKLINATGKFKVSLSAANGIEFLDKLNNNPIEIAILDVSMPGIDGFQVLESLNKTNPEIPVIILTGHQLTEYAEKAKVMGARHYIHKDNLFNELIPALNSVSKTI